MCLQDFESFEYINENNSLIGYRNWRLLIQDPTKLKSESRDYYWNKILEGPHEVRDKDSGIYSYNNYNYKYDNSYFSYSCNNHNCNNYSYFNHINYIDYNFNSSLKYNFNYYIISGIIYQYGKIAIHKDGYRSEYAKIKTLFTIRESDAEGTQEFLNWIKRFNLDITELAKKYKCETIHIQDYKE